MRVTALVGFVSTIDGIKYRVQEGDELTLPKGADWVNAGLCAATSVSKPKTVTKRAAKKKK